jgi:hypothetical protein
LDLSLDVCFFVRVLIALTPYYWMNEVQVALNLDSLL